MITLAESPQDSRDFYREKDLVCAGCGHNNNQVAAWLLPGLCTDCAFYVESVTAAAPRSTPAQQPQLFSTAPVPR